MLQQQTQLNNQSGNKFTVSLARLDSEVCAALRLRYKVFVEEMGAKIPDSGDRKSTRLNSSHQ